MELETKPIARDSLRGLIDATRDAGRPHAHVIRRRRARESIATVREPSALRGLILLVLIALVVRALVLSLF